MIQIDDGDGDSSPSVTEDSDVSPGSPPGHDTPGGSQGAASTGSGVWAALPNQGRHQETRHSTRL